MNFSDDEKTKRRLVKLVANMSKYVVLVTLALFSSVLFSILFGVSLIDGNFSFASDIFINSICLYLQFSFNKKYYNFICKPCQQAVQKMFWGNIERSLLLANYDPHKSTITSEFTGFSDKRLNAYKNSETETDLYNNNQNDNENTDTKNPDSYIPPTTVQLQIAQLNNEQDFD